MTQASAPADNISRIIERMLSGPARPGQAFTMPGCNYGTLYRMARRIKAVFERDEDQGPVCLWSDDRAVMAAGLLASLAGGPELLLPHALSAPAFTDLRRMTGFVRAIGQSGEAPPGKVELIDPAQLSNEVETLTSAKAPESDRPWVRLFTGGSTGAPRVWSKTPRNLLGESDYLINQFAIGSGDRILATVPALHIYGLLYSLLVPLVASARVGAPTPSFPEEIKQRMAEVSPTIFVSVPVHYRALKDNPPEKGALRLAFSSTGPLNEVDGQAFSNATGVDLLEVYGSTETGGIATRCRTKGEAGFTPYGCIQWRVTGSELDIRSAFLSAELPVRSSGWFTVGDRVQAHGSDGFVVTGRAGNIVKVGGNRVDQEKVRQAIARLTTVHRVQFKPAGLTVPVDESKTIQELAADHGIEIRSDCGGMGACGKCRVNANPKENFSPLTDAELDVLTPDQMAEGSRLACLARATGKATVTIPETLAVSSATRGKTAISGSFPVDPMTRRLTVEALPPGLNSDNVPQSLVDWLAAQIGEPVAAVTDIASLRRLSSYRDSLKTFTLVVHDETGMRRIIAGQHPAGLGFAVDLGTTSMAGYLCDLQTGTLLAAEACINPQRRFGEDVISRITRINEKSEHLDQLQELAAEGINILMTRCLAQAGAAVDAIDEMAVCGNTTMQQILAGIHPYGLGVFPYFPLTLTAPALSAGDLGLAADPAVPVFLMPVISGFVGGDTMAAILADRPHERDATTLIVDIGTNGEVVLGSREGLWVTSCATGPALEGAQISCGMRAVSGAIHRVWPETDKDRVAYAVLGNAGKNRPMGLCGSGIIDAIAALRRLGVILPNGRLDEANAGVVSNENGVGRRYTIAGRDRSATGNEISVTQNDVRQIQLAKGALCTGIEFLMHKAGIENIDRTILTGAFGARFNWQNALAIGMLPPAVARGEVVSVENLAGVGVAMALLDKKLRSEARSLCRRIRYLELASEPDFATAFARATAFPEISV